MDQMIERVVRFTVNENPFAPFLCSPESLDELAVGHLLTQGYIDSAKAVRSVRVDGLSVSATVDGLQRPLPLDERIDALQPVDAAASISMGRAIEIMRVLVSVKGFYGTHSLAIYAPAASHTRQDVGRHNAMDKVIGRVAMDGGDFSRCIVAATGRISMEMLLKVASVGIPVIISKKYPSDLSARVAERLNICIIGNILSDSPIVYSAQERAANS